MADWREMSESERAKINKLRTCSFLPGSADKWFARDLGYQADVDKPQITDKQSTNLDRLAHKYRRQIG